MSDISIPGVSNQFNTSKIIGDIMKLERRPLDRLEGREKTLQKRRAAWQDLNRAIATLRNEAQGLYSFTNPFEDRVASSSNSAALTATANRTAQVGAEQITVKKIARADAFLSSSLPDTFTVPPGDYGFAVGKKELSFEWGGGNLKDFAKRINQRSRGLIETTVIDDTASTQVLQIRSTVTGAENTLTFTKGSTAFALAAGIIAKTGVGSRTIPVDAATIQPWTKPVPPGSFVVANGALTLKPGAELALPVSPPITAEKGLMIEFTATIRNLPQSEAGSAPPTGPTIPPTGGIDFRGITVHSSPSVSGIPAYSPPPPPPVVDNLGVVSLGDDGKTVKLPDLAAAAGPQTIQLPLSDYVANLTSLDFRNLNTNRDVVISGIKVVNPNARGEYSPLHVISRASDAELDLDGVSVTRPKNSIDDLIPGVTLVLHAPSEGPLTLDVAPNKKKIKDEIIGFIGDYNNLMADLEIYTSRDPKVIEEITYYTPEQRTAAQEKLGLFQDDFAVNNLKSHLQEIMMNPYQTPGGDRLSLLAQIGISTNTSNTYTGFDIAKLRGYLDIDETKLDNALATNLSGVKDLFGYALGGDLIINSGVAYSLDQYLRGYNSLGGIIPSETQSLDQSIAQTKRDIANLQQQLAQKKQQLEDKYNQMQGTIDTLQQNSKAIQELGGQGGGGAAGAPGQ